MICAIALAFAGIFWPSALTVCWIVLSLVFTAVFIDIAVTGYVVRHISIRRHAPDVMSLDQPNPVDIGIDVNIPIWLRPLMAVTTYIEIPDGFSSVSETEFAGAGTFRYSMTPNHRGRHALGAIYVHARTKYLGLVVLRKFDKTADYTKVYPTFKFLERLENQPRVNEMRLGMKKIRRAGNSTDFDQIRPYVPGDDKRHINWHATARTTNLMVNTYTDERSKAVIPVICAGPSMLVTTEGISLLDRATSSAVSLAATAIRHYDEAGLITLSHAGVEDFIKPNRSSSAIHRILETTYDFGMPPTQAELPYVSDPDVLPDDINRNEYDRLCQRMMVASAEADLEALAAYVTNRLKRRSLLVVYANFENLEIAKAALPHFQRIARRHTLLLILLQNEGVEAEAKKPYNARSVSSRLSEQRFRNLCADYVARQYQLSAFLTHNGINVITTTPQDLSVAVISKYIELKNRAII